MSEIDENEDWDNYGENDGEDDWDYRDDDCYNYNLDNFNYCSEQDEEIDDEFDKNSDDIKNNVFIKDIEVHNFFHNNLKKQEKIENRRNKNKNTKENNKIIVENLNNSKLIIDEFNSDLLSNKSLDECGSLINKLKIPTHIFEDVQDTNEKVNHGGLFLNVYNRNEKQVSGVEDKSIIDNNNIKKKKKQIIKNNNNMRNDSKNNSNKNNSNNNYNSNNNTKNGNKNNNNNSKLIIDEFNSDLLSNKSLDECGSLINKLKIPTHIFEDVQDTNDKVNHGGLFLNVYNRNEKQVSGVEDKSIINNNNIKKMKKQIIDNKNNDNNNNNNNNMKNKNNNKMNKVIDRYKSKYLSSAASDGSGKCNNLSVSDIDISGNKKCPFPTVTSVSCEREILTAAGSSGIFLNSTLLDSENLN